MQLFVRGSQTHTFEVNGSETITDIKVILNVLHVLRHVFTVVLLNA